MKGARPGWKALFVLVLAAAVAADLAGCAQLQRKFTRKKKDTGTKLPHYHPVKEFVKESSPALYEKHYVYWRSAQSELLDVLGENRKKDMRCINDIISNLRDMQSILIPEKGAELDPHIARLEVVRTKIATGEPSTYMSTYVRSVLESEERFVRNNFRYKKVKDCLRQSSDSSTSVSATVRQAQDVSVDDERSRTVPAGPSDGH